MHPVALCAGSSSLLLPRRVFLPSAMRGTHVKEPLSKHHGLIKGFSKRKASPSPIHTTTTSWLPEEGFMLLWGKRLRVSCYRHGQQ